MMHRNARTLPVVGLSRTLTWPAWRRAEASTAGILSLLDTLQDICLRNGPNAQDRYSGLHKAARGHCDQWKGAESRAVLLARSMPSDRQGENERDQ